MKSDNLHKLVIMRLLLALSVLIIVIGGSVFYIKTEEIDEVVVKLALQESRSLSHDDFLNIETGNIEAIKQKSAELISQHFVIVEIYDQHKQLVWQEVAPGSKAVSEKAHEEEHEFPVGQDYSYDKHIIDKQIYLNVLLPVKDPAGQTLGYFEGIYKVDAETQQRLINDLIMTLALVVIVITFTTIMLYPIIISLNKGLIKFSKDLLRGNIELMEVLGSAIAQRDSDTNVHNYRVTIYAIRLGEAASLQPRLIQNLIAGAFLHDVGKIGISDTILLKPGKLSDQEMVVMQTHVLRGLDIINKSRWLGRARDVVEYHHEKYDGSGYMRGLKGEQIPILARIFAIVDVFDALTSKRPYKDPYPYQEAAAMMLHDSGKHFDPHLLDLFLSSAKSLYDEVNAIDDDQIANKLSAMIEKYLFIDKYR